MSAVLLEAHYMGCCRYWNTLLQHDTILIDRYEHFQKRSYRNRAHLLSPNGILRLSVPLVHGKHQHAAMQDIRISYKERWQKIHWQSLTSCYRRSPYFEYYEHHFRSFYETEHEYLLAFNVEFLKTIAGLLHWKGEWSFTESYAATAPDGVTDARNRFLPQDMVNMPELTYPQVFSDRFAFQPDLSVLDVLFNKGKMSRDYLQQVRF